MTTRPTHEKKTKFASLKSDPVYSRIREILESARSHVARTVNTTQVVTNWLIGREIVEEEQQGKKRAGYGKQLIQELSERLSENFGRGFSAESLSLFRRFYLEFPELLDRQILYTPSTELPEAQTEAPRRKSMTTGSVPEAQKMGPDRTVSDTFSMLHAVRGESWKPGQLHPNLSWSLYRHLMRVDRPDIRAFYEIEAIGNHWSARELERQINSLLYERLAKSKDKKGLMRLATKGHEIQTAADVFKDPLVIEFPGLPESTRLVESDLEKALIDHLQAFLLELGKGFAFVDRQQRITLEGDHFYIDLVFYHIVLKCYVLIDLKIGKLTHQDLGQLQLYVNYYDQEKRTTGDQPTLGLILCTDKNDTVIKYTLAADQKKKFRQSLSTAPADGERIESRSGTRSSQNSKPPQRK